MISHLKIHSKTFYFNPYNRWKIRKNTMCEIYEIPEKEVVSNKKLEKEKQQEEKPLTVTA